MKYLKKFNENIHEKDNLLFINTLKENDIDRFKSLLYEYLNYDDSESPESSKIRYRGQEMENKEDFLVVLLMWCVAYGRVEMLEELLYLKELTDVPYTDKEIDKACEWAKHSRRKNQDEIRQCIDILKNL